MATDKRRSQRGQAMVEYTVALAFIVLAFAVGAETLRGLWGQQLQMTADGLSSTPILGRND